MQVGRKGLEQRRTGQLDRTLGRATPGESQEELDRIDEADRRKAEEGLVELRSGDEVWFKHIDEITREDRQARIESENASAANLPCSETSGLKRIALESSRCEAPGPQ